jgi:type I restriction enzyme R subunit
MVRTATGSTRSSTHWVAVYVQDLDEDGQVTFKGRAKAFMRTFDFLTTILP